MTTLDSRSMATLACRDQLEKDEELVLSGEWLGKGTYARVRKAFSKKIGADVAIKIMDRRQCKPDFTGHFLPRELELVRRLRHPNCIRVMRVVDQGEIVCLVEEYAHHGDLLRRIQKDKFIPETLARPMYRQLTEGVHYLHSMNVAHRDLKCENIFLDQYDNVKLGDYGFARVMDSLSKTYCGSRAYAAPEILRAIPYTSTNVDIWSCGVILYIMVTGCMPFNQKHANKMLKSMYARISFPTKHSTVSSGAKSLVRAMLRGNAEERATYEQQCTHRWLVDTPWRYKDGDKIYELRPVFSTTPKTLPTTPPEEENKETPSDPTEEKETLSAQPSRLGINL